MTRFSTSLAAGILAAGIFLGLSPASASIVQIQFYDSLDEGGPGELAIFGQFTLDTDVALGTLESSQRFLFDPLALLSFSATISEAGTTLATLGVDLTQDSGIRLTQGAIVGPGYVDGYTLLRLQLGNFSGDQALTGASNTTGISILFRSNDSGASGPDIYQPDLLYDNENDLLNNIMLSPSLTELDRRYFDNGNVLSGFTGITLTNFAGTNYIWSLESLSVQDVTPPASPVPLPAGGILLFGALGVLGLIRRRHARKA